VLTFDDGTDDHRTVADRLTTLGLTGTFFVVSGFVDAASRLRRADIRSMADRGHRIGSHAVNHRKLTDLQPHELAFELTESKRALEQLAGRPVDWFAPPGGFFSDVVLSAAAEHGFRVVRTMEWGYSGNPIRGKVPCLPVLPNYGPEGFQDLISGRAPLWKYRIKKLAKRAVGDRAYVRVRDGLDVIRRRFISRR